MAIYPNNTPSDADLYVAVDNFGATLSAAIDNSQTTISLSTVVGLPTVGILTIDSEKVKYTGISGNDLTGCARGFSATTAASHTLGASVWFNVVEEHHNSLKDEVIAVATDNRNTFSSDLNDAVSPTATAVSLKERLDMIVTQIKGILGSADWKDTISNTLSSLASSISGLTSSKKSIATGNAYKFETTGATGDLQETTVTASRAVVTDANGLPAAATTTAAEIDYVSGVTSSIQTQLGNKANDADVVHDTGNETVAGVKTFTSTVNLPSINGSGVFGFRNRIINGDMRIDQRNAGAAVAVTTSPVYAVDRWNGDGVAADGVFTLQRNSATPPTGFKFYMTSAVTTADASVGSGQVYRFRQAIEGYNVADFLYGTANAKTTTLSFWCISSLTGTFGGCYRNASNNRAYVFQYTINSALTWEYKTITIPGDTSGTWLTDNSAGLELIFDLGSGTSLEGTANTWNASNVFRASGNVRLISTLNATLSITGVQVEIGPTKTDFEYRLIQTELELCQRYFWKSLNQAIAAVDNPNTARGAIAYRAAVTGVAAQGSMCRFPVPMRDNPTITFFNSGATGTAWRNESDGANSGASSAEGIGETGFYARNAQAAGDTIGDLLLIHVTASAEL